MQHLGIPQPLRNPQHIHQRSPSPSSSSSAMMADPGTGPGSVWSRWCPEPVNIAIENGPVEIVDLPM